MLKMDVAIKALTSQANDIERDIETASERALDAAAEEASRRYDAHKQQTYDRGPAILPSGKPAWEQTGAWKESTEIESRLGERVVSSPGQEWKEEHLYDLPNSPIDGKNRSNKAQENTIEEDEDAIVDAFEREFLSSLGF